MYSVAVAPVQRRSKETYENIVSAAARLLEREGVAQMTVQKVAESAGVDARLVRYYFDDLEGLMVVIGDHAVARWAAVLREQLAGHDDPRDAIADGLDSFWRSLARSDPGARRQSLSLQEIRLWAARSEALHALPRRSHEEFEGAWVEAFEAASDRYTFSIEPPVLARMIYDAWDGVVGDYLTTGDVARAREALDGFIAAFSLMINPR